MSSNCVKAAWAEIATSACCRGRNSATMEGLRKRISTLFLQFIENPVFNPEAANFFNLGKKTCSTENYMYTGMTAPDSDKLAAQSWLD